MEFRSYLTVVLVFLYFPSFVMEGMAQKGSKGYPIHGEVVDTSGIAVPYVNLSIKEEGKGGTTGQEGEFRIETTRGGEVELYISAIGYKDTVIKVGPSNGSNGIRIVLKEETHEMEEVVVTGTMKERRVRNSPVKIEVMDRKYLNSIPSGNLMESVDRMNGVRKQVNCGVCGTNNIRINGMEGPYTLLMIDGMPIMSSLGSVYGFNGIPNSLIDQVEVIKGPSSTLYGTRAVGGVINIITREPAEMPKAEFRSFYTSHGESNTDLSLSTKVSDKVHTVISGNYFKNEKRIDENKDGFTDFPLSERISLFNKWSVALEDDREFDLAFRYYNEDRFGGVMGWDEGDKGSSKVYGESILTERFELIGNYELPFKDPVKLGFSYSDHFQDSYYGDEHFRALQRIGYAFLTWRKNLADHDLMAGLNGRYREYYDNTPAMSDEELVVPGVFIQDEWQKEGRWTILAGIRYDHHPEHGGILSPRLNLKGDLSEYTTFRLNGGSGFREVDVFTEDHAALTGSREVHIAEELDPERSWNISANLGHVYTSWRSTGTVDLDVFYTYFTNKIVPDLDSDPDAIIYRNLHGTGVSRGIGLSASHDFEFPVEVRLGGTYQEVYNRRGGGERSFQIHSPKFTGTFQVEYAHLKSGVEAVWSGNVYGPQRLPSYPEPYDRKNWSPWYSIHDVKISGKLAEEFEIFGGVRNLFDHTQPTPLVDPENPFGEHFDTEYVYGPLQGRRFLVGLRWEVH